MKYYIAEIEDNRVANIIVANEEHILRENEILIGEYNTVSIGWECIDGVIIRPPEIEEELEED